MTRTLIAVALLVGSSRLLGAQAIPALGAAKGAAQRAVNATNANIAEQTGQPVAKPRTTTPANTGFVAATPSGTAGATSSPGTNAVAGSVVAQNTAARTAPPAGTAKDSVKSGATRGTAQEFAFSREVYSYEASGRRDPFLSLLASGDLRPAYNDLKLVAVAYDPTGRKSVAVMRDVSSNDQYRVKVGQTLGRMRVAQIHPKSVTFTIDEFGYSRQEILALGDSTNKRTP